MYSSPFRIWKRLNHYIAQARVNQELAKGVIPFSRFWASGPSRCAFCRPALAFHPEFHRHCCNTVQWVVRFMIWLTPPERLLIILLGDAYDFIPDVEGYPSSIIYFFVVIGLFILRCGAPQAPRPFKAWWPVPHSFSWDKISCLSRPS